MTWILCLSRIIIVFFVCYSRALHDECQYLSLNWCYNNTHIVHWKYHLRSLYVWWSEYEKSERRKEERQKNHLREVKDKEFHFRFRWFFPLSHSLTIYSRELLLQHHISLLPGSLHIHILHDDINLLLSTTTTTSDDDDDDDEEEGKQREILSTKVFRLYLDAKIISRTVKKMSNIFLWKGKSTFVAMTLRNSNAPFFTTMRNLWFD